MLCCNDIVSPIEINISPLSYNKCDHVMADTKNPQPNKTSINP